jgi:hypothetical protein
LSGVPYVRGSDTSETAAESMVGKVDTLRAQYLSYILAQGETGATCDEVESWSDDRHQTVSARIKELADAGKVKDSGRRRKTRSGREATVWIVPGARVQKTGMDAEQHERDRAKKKRTARPKDPFTFDMFTGETAPVQEKGPTKLSKGARLVLEQLAAWSTEHEWTTAAQLRASPPPEVNAGTIANVLVELRRRQYIRDKLLPENCWEVGRDKTSIEVTEAGWLFIRNLNEAEARPADPAPKKATRDTVTIDILDQYAWMKGRVRQVCIKRSGFTVMHFFQEISRDPQDEAELLAAERALEYAVEMGWADPLPDHPQTWRDRTVKAYCSRVRGQGKVVESEGGE